MTSKKYGLILPDKRKAQQLSFKATRNVFGNDSDSEDESRKKPVLLRPSDLTNRQAKIAQENAVKEDPTVYQYDEIYEDMITKKDEKKVKNKEEKKPRYIENLMKTANKRKIENERRVERQIQREREKEGDEFKDKEVFVTTAYKKKLEEMKLEEEKEKREEYLENVGDVTKQADLGGFYRHLYEQKLGKDICNQNEDKNPVTSNDKQIESKDNDSMDNTKKRNYRKRKCSADIKNQLSEGEIEESDEEINRVNLDDIRMAKKSKQIDDNIDADSDFSIDESSDDDTKEKKSNNDKDHSDRDDSFKKPAVPVSQEVKSNSESIETTIDTLPVEEELKPKVDIWKKRTVGEVFDQALKRYYERKAARG